MLDCCGSLEGDINILYDLCLVPSLAVVSLVINLSPCTMAPRHSNKMKATMKRTIVCAILGMSSLCPYPVSSLAVMGDWAVVVIEKGSPVPGAIVSVAFPDGIIVEYLHYTRLDTWFGQPTPWNPAGPIPK